jgi:hypothetical protein
VMVPLNFKHLDSLSSCASFLGIQYSDGMLSIRQIGFNFDGW